MSTSSVDSLMIKKAEELKILLCTFEPMLKECSEEDFVKVKEILASPLCKVIKTIVPQVQRKIDEIILANELGFLVCKSERGADIEDDEGNSYEVKTSICQSLKNYKSNFVWPIPKGKNEDETRKKLLQQVLVKTEGPEGGVYFIANNIRGVELNRYFLSSQFVISFFQHLPLPKSGTYNFGCERCITCNNYHRLTRLVFWDKNNIAINDAECELYKKISAQCIVIGKKKKKTT